MTPEAAALVQLQYWIQRGRLQHFLGRARLLRYPTRTNQAAGCYHRQRRVHHGTFNCNTGYTGGGTWTCGNQRKLFGHCMQRQVRARLLRYPTRTNQAPILSPAPPGPPRWRSLAINGYTGGGTWTCGASGQLFGHCMQRQVRARLTEVAATRTNQATGSITGAMSESTTVTVTCNNGYTGGGAWTCGASGQLFGHCMQRQVRARLLRYPTRTNQALALSPATTGSTTVTFNCDAGYTGGGTWTCGTNGQLFGH